MTVQLTCRVSAALEVLIEYLECLRRKRRSSLAFLGRHEADEVAEVLCAVLVALLGHRHPPLEHRLDLLRALRRYVQLLKPASPPAAAPAAGYPTEVTAGRTVQHTVCVGSE